MERTAASDRAVPEGRNSRASSDPVESTAPSPLGPASPTTEQDWYDMIPESERALEQLRLQLRGYVGSVPRRHPGPA